MSNIADFEGSMQRKNPSLSFGIIWLIKVKNEGRFVESGLRGCQIFFLHSTKEFTKVISNFAQKSF